MTENEDKFDLIKQNDISFNVDFVPTTPSIRNLDDIKSTLQTINDRYGSLVLTEEDIDDINKRGGIITQLNKIDREIYNEKQRVHREAKNAYADFDKEADSLSEIINSSKTNLKTQITKFEEKIQQERIDKLSALYDQLLAEQFPEFNEGDRAKFVNFHDILKNSQVYTNKGFDNDNKRNEVVLNYFTTKVDHYNKLQTAIENHADSSLYIDTLKNVYVETNDPNQAIVSAQDKIDYADRLIRERAAEQQKSEEIAKILDGGKDVPGTAGKPADAGKIEKLSEKAEKIGFVFAVGNQQDAKKLKQFLQSEGITYNFKVVKG